VVSFYASHLFLAFVSQEKRIRKKREDKYNKKKRMKTKKRKKGVMNKVFGILC